MKVVVMVVAVDRERRRDRRRRLGDRPRSLSRAWGRRQLSLRRRRRRGCFILLHISSFSWELGSRQQRQRRREERVPVLRHRTISLPLLDRPLPPHQRNRPLSQANKNPPLPPLSLLIQAQPKEGTNPPRTRSSSIRTRRRLTRTRTSPLSLGRDLMLRGGVIWFLGMGLMGSRKLVWGIM